MFLAKLLSKFKKEIKDSIKFNYDDNYIYIQIDFENLNIDIKNFIEMSMFDLEDIFKRENNIFSSCNYFPAGFPDNAYSPITPQASCR